MAIGAGIVIMCLVSTAALVAQRSMRIQDADSLRQLLLDKEISLRQRALVFDGLSEAHHNDGNTDSAYYYTEKLMTVAKALKSDTLLGKAFRGLAIVNLQNGEGPQSLINSDSALYYFTRAKDERMQLIILSNLSYQLATTGDCVGAIAMGKRADSLQATLTIPFDKRVKFRNTYCAVLTNCELFDLVPTLAKEYLAEVSVMPDKFLEANFVSRLIASYRGLGELDSALVYVQRMGELLPQLNSTSFASTYYTNAANVYFDRGEKDRARELLQLGLEYAKRHSSELSVNIKSLNLGVIELKDSNYQRSIDLLEEPLRFFEKARQLEALNEIYPALAQAYAGVGRYREAYLLNEQAFNLRDSLNRVAFDNSLAETVALNEAERARRELEISNLELAEQKAVNQSRFRMGLAILIGILSLFGILLLVYRSRRQRKELQFRQEQAELRYNLLRAQMNPHFIFNSLNAIQSFFSGKRFESGNEYLGMFSQLVRRILEQTGQSAISLHEELDTLRLYLNLEQLRMGELLSYAIHVDPAVELELLNVPPLVMQPFVENAIWHGIAPKNAPGRIDIFLTYHEDLESLRCIIQDDGMGMPANGENNNGHRSQGVSITRSRLGKGGSIDIHNRAESEPGATGVRTELLIPLKD